VELLREESCLKTEETGRWVVRVGDGWNWVSIIPYGGRRQEDNIKTDLREMGREGERWMELGQYHTLWRSLVLSVFNLRNLLQLFVQIQLEFKSTVECLICLRAIHSCKAYTRL